MRLLTICAAVILALGVSAQMLVPRVEEDAPELPPLKIAEQTVDITLDNQLATTRIEQIFVNNTDADVEAAYFIPLPETASVSEFAYWLDGKRIVGEIKEKAQARAEYEELTGLKRDPALLEHTGRNLFRANIYPIHPGVPLKVELQYEQVLPYDSGVVAYTYPLTMSGQQIIIGMLKIKVHLTDQKQIVSVESPRHPFHFDRPDQHTATTSYAASDITPHNDVTIRYEVSSAEMGVNFLAHRPGGEKGYFMLMLAPQEETTAADIAKKDVILVFDKSGSMEGEKIAQSRRALEFCLRHLSDTDRFGLVIYDAEIYTFREEIIPATQGNMLPALEYVEKIAAGGMTNINDALLVALRMLGSSDRQRTIIFLTDGLPTEGVQETAQILQNVRAANTTDTRIFTFGVGDDVDDYLLLKIAQANRGASEHVRTNESIYDKLSAFYSKISTPLLVDPAIDFGEVQTSQVYPAVLPDIFKGSQVIISGRYEGSGEQTVVLTGEVNGEPRRYEYAARFPQQADENPVVARVWAKDRVTYLLDQVTLQGETEELKEEIIALSKQYHFVTPYTSMLAVPEEPKAAMNQSAFPMGGDPWIRVSAPPDTVRVTAIFPWGETMPLIYDPDDGRWAVRFVVPKGAVHGSYEVIIIITAADGSQRHLTINYEADRQAPSGIGRAFAHHTGDGWVVTLSVKASADTRRVDALTPAGDLVGLNCEGDTYTGQITIPDSAVSGPSVFVPVYVTDSAHNRLEIEVEIELEQ
ncbi:MAG: VIT domain-containing protein [Armatimonadota bacterium]